MHILICDDELLYRAAIEQAVTNWSKASGHFDYQMHSFHSSEELLSHISANPEADLLFLDIKIPGELSGLELARSIRKTGSDIAIVFISNYDEYVYEGYTVDALRFLRKPVMDDDIFFCCSYVYNRLALTRANSIAIQTSRAKLTLKHLEILYIEVFSHTLYIHTTGHSSPLKIYMKLSDMKKLLPEELFVLCHRSYIVNIAHIRLITSSKVTLSNGEQIPVSKTQASSLNHSFDAYFRGGHISDGLDSI